jgi:hypothetical protein
LSSLNRNEEIPFGASVTVQPGHVPPGTDSAPEKFAFVTKLAEAGDDGEDTFTVTGNDGDEGALVPLASVSVAVNVCTPLAALFSVKVQLPDVSTAVLPTSMVPSYTVTVLLASALPANVIVLVVSTPLVAGEKDEIAGGGGALPVGGGGGGEPETGTTLISARVSVAPVFRPKKANVVLVPVAVTSKVYGTNVVVRLLVSEKIVVEPNVT